MPDPSDPISRSVVLRPMTAADLAFVVDLHRRDMPDGFFARLGPRFLAAFYRSMLHSRGTHCVVATSAGAPVGFLAGVWNTTAYRGCLSRRAAFLLPRAAAAMLRRPGLLVLFARTRAGIYLRRLRAITVKDRSDGPRAGSDAAVLSYVVVSPVARGQGVGGILLRDFEARSALGGAQIALLVTAAADLLAQGFYAAHGWSVESSTTTPDGKELVRMCRRLVLAEGPPAQRQPQERPARTPSEANPGS